MNYDVLKPILNKIEFWHSYNAGCNAIRDKQKQMKYRSENDLDCVLNDGNLQADMIFSLWTPLKLVLRELNHQEWSKNTFCATVLSRSTEEDQLEILHRYLPSDNELVCLLSELFIIGNQKCNTMILPKFTIQETTSEYWRKREYSLNMVRAQSPYNDYVPHFLYNCLKCEPFRWFGCRSGIAFAGRAFESSGDAEAWIREQRLEVFFKDPQHISPDTLIDISGSGAVTKSVPPSGEALENMLRREIGILENRKGKLG